MVSTGQKAILPLGILLFVIGLILVIFNQSTVDLCMDYTWHSPDRCTEAKALHSAGLICVILGLVLLGPGVYLLVEEVTEPERVRFRCPQCWSPITYQTSPLNCVNCGLRVDWSGQDIPEW